MQKKNLSSTYSKKMSVANVIDDISNEEQADRIAQNKPISAGGRGEIPATLGQEHLQFVDGIDEVPDWLQGTVWALITRMNQLTYIDSDFDFERLQCGVRAMLRPLQWTRKLTIHDVSQISYFVSIQLRKSKRGLERKYIVPGYQDITHNEISGGRTVIEDQQRGFAAQGMINNLRGTGGGYRRGDR